MENGLPMTGPRGAFEGFRPVHAFVVFMAIYLAFGLLTLKKLPPVNYNIGDEFWALDLSRNVLTDRSGERLIDPTLYFMLQGAWLRISGGALFAARMFTLLTSVVVLWLTYVLGRKIGGGRAGVYSAVLLGTSFAFLWHGRIVRPEIMSTAFVLGALLMLIKFRKTGEGVAPVMSGLLASLAVLVHANNIQYIPAFIVLYAIFFKRKWSSAGFPLGLGAGFAVWATLKFMIWKPAAGAGMSGATDPMLFPVLKKGFFPLFMDTLSRIPHDYMEYIRLFNSFYSTSLDMRFVVIPFSIVSVAGLFTRMRREVFYLLLFVGVSGLSSYFLTAWFGYYHYVEFYPFLSVAAVLGLVALGERKRLGRLALVVVIVFAIAGLYETGSAYARFRKYDYGDLISKVSEGVDGKVISAELYSPAFGKNHLGNWFNFLERPGVDCPPFGEEAERLGAKYVVADDLLRTYARMSCGVAYEGEMIRFLTLKCKLFRRVEAEYPNYWVRGGIVKEIYIFRTPFGG